MSETGEYKPAKIPSQEKGAGQAGLRKPGAFGVPLLKTYPFRAFNSFNIKYKVF